MSSPRAAARAVPIGYLAAIYRFFRDPNASIVGKLFVFLTVAYVVWPIDAIPDVAPILGWLDDLGIATLALAYLGRVAARYRHALPQAPGAPAP
ncbi:YkvA family protein [Pendulispora albinea]|uniref:DUF1232 domain-containing protein n=1 Tax=Pendulispora albinea TaxID=2741071 RepID=A0ABZ2LUZ4_9BACT